MKILLDSCMTGRSAGELRGAGHDVIWSGDWREDPGDDAILAAAFADGRILVTQDKDFGELAVVRGARHAGILRLVGIAARDHASVIIETLSRHGEILTAGALVVVDVDRTRVRFERDD